jgi:hypothetical protein
MQKRKRKRRRKKRDRKKKNKKKRIKMRRKKESLERKRTENLNLAKTALKVKENQEIKKDLLEKGKRARDRRKEKKAPVVKVHVVLECREKEIRKKAA